MTEDEARKIGQHCIDAWPSGPKAYIWREAIIDLDYGTTVGAYRALIRDAEKSPTPARLLAHYNALRPRSTSVGGVRFNGDEISFDEYLSRVSRRSAAGDENASAELERWERWLGRSA